MSRILAISDIHGHIEGARRLLAAASYTPGSDQLMLLGDYIDYASETWPAIDYIRQLTDEGAIAIAGNMETWLCSQPQAALDHTEHSSPLPSSRLSYIETLPLYIEQDDYLFVHAGIRSGIPLEQQLPADLTGIRESFWTVPFPFSKPIVFGHTPTFKLGAPSGHVWFGPGMIGIDTGAKHGLRLSLLDLTNRQIYSCSTSSGSFYEPISCCEFPIQAAQ
ncbi:metallophosphoesterase [Paenibacillus turpanensis]|uniref:metallophosphoesterase n=1 Tax=Paenibacillus turpanensis TaxID=2689078 RepID=UPI001408972F|nr:metallophosphoesterase [Paenibacillus turpanensis]